VVLHCQEARGPEFKFYTAKKNKIETKQLLQRRKGQTAILHGVYGEVSGNSLRSLVLVRDHAEVSVRWTATVHWTRSGFVIPSGSTNAGRVPPETTCFPLSWPDPAIAALLALLLAPWCLPLP
jgi:hypothetical protein